MNEIEKNILNLKKILNLIDTPLYKTIKLSVEGVDIDIAGDTKFALWKLIYYAYILEKGMDIETQESYITSTNSNATGLTPKEVVDGVNRIFYLIDNNELEEAKKIRNELEKEVYFDADINSHIPMTIRRKEIMGE
jgi:hypothetical protein